MPHRSDSEARLAAIVATSNDAIISKDLSGTILSWNAAAERMFGYTAAEAIGQSITLIVPDDRRSEAEHMLAQVRDGGGVDHYPTVRRRKDGAPVEVLLSASAIRSPAGDVVGAWTVVRDVTMAKRLEREALQLAAIVESADDAIVSKDLNGIIQSWNRGAERMFGYTADEAIGKSITILMPEERLDEETEVITRIRAGESVEHFETVRRRKDGSPIDISLTVSPIHTSTGEVIGASKIARDITEQRRLRQIAEEASRLKDEFLAVLSHELRTPLNTVLGYARMLRREDERMVGELRQRALDALERNADSLSRLVNDVLDTSRSVTGKLRLDLDTVPLDDIVMEAIQTVAPSADAKGLTLETHTDPAISVRADRDRLQQVLWNLLSNAIKFTPAHGTITLRTRKGLGSIAITVHDSGIGILPEHLPYVFQRFWQAHTGASREFGGLGIGLALSRLLVEMHGGTIAADSGGPGRGATFTVTLPNPSTSLARERNLRPVANNTKG
jgi:PAS domain S-box-containing protein